MQIALTSVKTITSKKDGTEYQILEGLNQKGETIKAFLSGDQKVDIAGLEVSEERLKELFKTLPVVDVLYGPNNRVERVEV